MEMRRASSQGARKSVMAKRRMSRALSKRASRADNVMSPVPGMSRKISTKQSSEAGTED